MTNKQQNYVFCVDSDGCAMDTMTYKHQLFFGPLAADIFEVNDKEIFLQEWDRINLFSETRGVNRFVGLVMGLEYAGVSGITALKNWVETTNSLSNQSLEAEIAKEASQDLIKALQWSNEVNHHIKSYEGQALAFEGTKKALEKLGQVGQVFVVSSANKEAVEEEWKDQGLIPYVADLYCQDRGKKEDVIAQLISEGYDQSKILMIGDSPGDLAAAEMNQVSFYPILVGQEKASWLALTEKFADLFISNGLDDLELAQLKEKFWKNLQ
ncbi:HAD family hydrolase [Streptococcus pseudoporcinus]|uniref:HAD hydrolase, family IA, variant 1 n=1 Tax=Streptococcus pseudoporcinus LQ 940-04 TaxID=875093 RepID=G5K9G4_9STRE|nr:HAD-IA family hydrolase [Streptococcus pseudoporcinus]EFR44002.1 hydrolase, haloacid dehalogenase-like family protein [Streptococcus pseudoporcinus SPIN 20026]EHI64960.1 HAD hydrolase, family IA, variant 1 [Streptococcus pseudoporcinus LQ 940-04]VEF93337.1 phosphoglycolate phosphatase [Streptococcus pseudoporcinus]